MALAMAAHAANSSSEQTLDEVIIIAERMEPWELRSKLIELEDRFYERFNAINDRDEYDVNCIVTASTGTNLKHRECRPVFEARAIQKQATEMFLVRQDVQYFGTRAVRLHGDLGMPAIAEIEVIRPRYRAHMVSLVQGDETLQELLKQRAALEDVLRGKRESGDASGGDETQ